MKHYAGLFMRYGAESTEAGRPSIKSVTNWAEAGAMARPFLK